MIMDEQHKISRRKAIGGLGAGLASFAVAPAFGATNATGFTFATALEDPTTKYPKPPFKEQAQSWPGLASKMDPYQTMAKKAIKVVVG
jgi:hypothetical protein